MAASIIIASSLLGWIAAAAVLMAGLSAVPALLTFLTISLGVSAIVLTLAVLQQPETTHPR